MPVPQYDELMNPTLQAMHKLGGQASISSLENEVATILKLSEDDINEIHKGATTKLSYRLAWTRNYLKRFGILKKVSRGIWELTDKGLTTNSVDKEQVKTKVKLGDIENELNEDLDEVIIDDSDTLIEDLYENSSLYPYDIIEEVDVREDPLTVYEILRKLKQNKIIINPEFQRNLVWDPDQKSRFIESIILNIPLPPIYIYQDPKGNYVMVDGLQRTTTIRDFLNNDFELTGLKALPKFNKLYYSDLDEDIQTRIEDKKILIYVIKPTMPLHIVYDIFNRINTGGTQLTRQEIRNCIFIGPATELLKELSEKDYFKIAIDWGISSRRMKDREAILRYLAFKLFDYNSDYFNDMDDFLGEAMKKINKTKESDLNKLRADFQRTMVFTYDFFQERNFRLPTGKSRGRINIALMESVCRFFSICSDDFLTKNKSKIISNYDILMKNNEFLDAIRNSTGHKSRVVTRFELATEILGKI